MHFSKVYFVLLCIEYKLLFSTKRYNLTIIHSEYVYIYVCLYVMLLLLDPLQLERNTFRGSSTTPRSGHLRLHGRVIYDPTVRSSTTPRTGHLRPHGRVIYDPTVGSSTTPRARRLSLFVSKFTPMLPFLGTVELTCVVIM